MNRILKTALLTIGVLGAVCGLCYLLYLTMNLSILGMPLTLWMMMVLVVVSMFAAIWQIENIVTKK